MQKFEKDWENKPGNWESFGAKSLKDFYDMIWQDTGLPSTAKGSLPANIWVYTRPKEFDNTLTLRAVLEWIAEAVGCNAKFDRNGVLQFVWVRGVARTYDEGNYREFSPYWYQTKQVTSVVTRSTDKNKEGTIRSGSGGETYLVQDNPFLQMFHTEVISQEYGPWKEDFDWLNNDIDIFDDEYYWDLERVKVEFSIIRNNPDPEEEPEGEGV